MPPRPQFTIHGLPPLTVFWPLPWPSSTPPVGSQGYSPPTPSPTTETQNRCQGKVGSLVLLAFVSLDSLDSREMSADSRPPPLIGLSYFYINPERWTPSLVKLNLHQRQEAETAYHNGLLKSKDKEKISSKVGNRRRQGTPLCSVLGFMSQ